MTLKQMEQDFHFLRGQVQRLSRLIDALESSPLLVQAMTEPAPELEPEPPREVDAPTQEVRTIAELEKEAILNARDTFGKNHAGACSALGISRTSYYRKLREYGVRG
jgi:transcriptional regulator with PAS, ATPase and Fis domain